MEIVSRIKAIEPRYYTVAILCAINLLNYMDRYAVASVLLDIQSYFNLQNQAAGLIQTVFVTCYMACAPFAGYLGDRHDRKVIILVGVSIWGATTLASSFVGRDSFWLFLTLRAIVGVGEASYSTVAPTIFADLFPEQPSTTPHSATATKADDRRLACLSAFYFAIPVGSGLGYILASWLAHATHYWAWGLRVTPIIGATLLVVFYRYVHNIPDRSSPAPNPVHGPTLIVTRGDTTKYLKSSRYDGDDEEEARAPLIVPVHRIDVTYGEGSTMIPPGLSAWFSDVFVLLRIPTFTAVSLAITWVSFVVGALALWAPTFMQLSANANGPPVPVTQEEIGFRFGLVTCGAGALGLVGGGELARKFRHSLGNRADPLVCGWGLMAGSPLLYAALYLAKYASHNASPWTRALSWVAIFLAETCFCACWALVVDVTLSVVPASLRSTSQATQMLISHALGDGSSAYIVGAVSQAILNSWSPSLARKGGSIPSFADRFKALQYALYITPFVGILGAHFFLRASQSIKKDTERAKHPPESTPSPYRTYGESLIKDLPIL